MTSDRRNGSDEWHTQFTMEKERIRPSVPFLAKDGFFFAAPGEVVDFFLAAGSSFSDSTIFHWKVFERPVDENLAEPSASCTPWR